MESLGIIEKVTQLTRQRAPMVVVVKKNGKIRICVDLNTLNESVEWGKFNLPAIVDLLPKPAGSTVFSSVDTASGFWQIPSEEDSALLMTFITPQGRYCFKRLPFGITSAPEIFQRKIPDLLQGQPAVMFIWMTTWFSIKQKSSMVRKVQPQQKRCTFSQSTLDFLGHVVNKDGIRPNPDRVAAIRDEGTKEHRRFAKVPGYG